MFKREFNEVPTGVRVGADGNSDGEISTAQLNPLHGPMDVDGRDVDVGLPVRMDAGMDGCGVDVGGDVGSRLVVDVGLAVRGDAEMDG